MCGVYIIRCLPTGDLYVGGTIQSFEERWRRHQTALRNKRGPPLLQQAYDEHGEGSLQMVPLKTFPPDQVHLREAEAIAILKPKLNAYAMTGSKRTTTQVSQAALAYRKRHGIPLDAPAHGHKRTYAFRGEMLTVPEIVERTGLTDKQVRNRIASGSIC